MRQTLLALALLGFLHTACDNPPPVVDDVEEESDELDAGSDGQDSEPTDAAQPD
jgi:hypothetical protein